MAKFPDLNKDGEVTQADVLKGRGVAMKKAALLRIGFSLQLKNLALCVVH